MSLGGGQEARVGEPPGSETKRLFGFISPVSWVDGNIVTRSLSKLNFVPLLLGQTQPLPLSGGGGALVQCTTCTAAHSRLAYLNPAAEPTLSFRFPSSLFSLSFPLYSFDPQEGRKDAKFYVLSAYLSFSLPPSSFQTTCAAGGSVWV